MKHTAYFRLPQILVLLQTRLGQRFNSHSWLCTSWLSIVQNYFCLFCLGYVMELLGIQVLFTKLRSPERLRNVRHVSYWQGTNQWTFSIVPIEQGSIEQDTQGKQCMRYTLNEVFKLKNFSASTRELKLSTYQNCSAGIRSHVYPQNLA